MKTWIAEVWYLVKALFSKVPKDNNMEIVQMRFFPFKGYLAMSWAGKLITRYDPSQIGESTKVHEGIHLQQARKMGGWFAFYLTYLIEYLWNLLGLWLGLNGSYYCIHYEMQAFGNELNENYEVTKENMKLYRFGFRKKKIWRENKKNWRAFCRGIEE